MRNRRRPNRCLCVRCQRSRRLEASVSLLSFREQVHDLLFPPTETEAMSEEWARGEREDANRDILDPPPPPVPMTPATAARFDRLFGAR